MNASKSLAVAVAAALTAVAISVAVQPAKAALISWSPPQTISGTSDVDTVGSLVAAVNFGSTASPTVAGVTFNSFTLVNGATSAALGSITVSGTSGNPTLPNLQQLTNVGSASNPYGSLPTDYKSLVGSTVYVAASAPLTVGISGLTVGASYSVQYWVNDSRPAGGTRAVTIGSQTLDVNSLNGAGGVGQWTTGTFVADATSQSFAAVGTTGGVAYANALQVRLVAIPEPSTWALGAAGCACAASCGKLRRRRR